jgi:hypothetical protein
LKGEQASKDTRNDKHRKHSARPDPSDQPLIPTCRTSLRRSVNTRGI